MSTWRRAPPGTPPAAATTSSPARWAPDLNPKPKPKPKPYPWPQPYPPDPKVMLGAPLWAAALAFQSYAYLERERLRVLPSLQVVVTWIEGWVVLAVWRLVWYAWDYALACIDDLWLSGLVSLVSGVALVEVAGGGLDHCIAAPCVFLRDFEDAPAAKSPCREIAPRVLLIQSGVAPPALGAARWTQWLLPAAAEAEAAPPARRAAVAAAISILVTIGSVTTWRGLWLITDDLLLRNFSWESTIHRHDGDLQEATSGMYSVIVGIGLLLVLAPLARDAQGKAASGSGFGRAYGYGWFLRFVSFSISLQIWRGFWLICAYLHPHLSTTDGSLEGFWALHVASVAALLSAGLFRSVVGPPCAFSYGTVDPAAAAAAAPDSGGRSTFRFQKWHPYLEPLELMLVLQDYIGITPYDVPDGDVSVNPMFDAKDSQVPLNRGGSGLKARGLGS